MKCKNVLTCNVFIVCITGQYTDSCTACRVNAESGNLEHPDWQQQASPRGQDSIGTACHRARGKGIQLTLSAYF